jgi:hypothetical protein
MADTWDPEGYRRSLDEWPDGLADFDMWLQLGGLLGGRPGWRFDPGDDVATPPVWSFVDGGITRLTLSPSEEEFVLYIVDQDDEHILDTVAEVADWLDEHEQEHRAPPTSKTP